MIGDSLQKNLVGLRELKRTSLKEYDEETLRFLASNLSNKDVFIIFQQVMRFRDRGGFVKSYLPDWNIKRRRYDNAFLILESTRFITRNREGEGVREPFFPTSFGEQLALYLINEHDFDSNYFRRISDDQYTDFLKTRQIDI